MVVRPLKIGSLAELAVPLVWSDSMARLQELCSRGGLALSSSKNRVWLGGKQRVLTLSA